MADDFDDYEDDYLRRLKEQDPEAARRESEKAARQREYASQTTFTAWDYVLLESIRRRDPRVRIRIGTMKVLDGLEKLILAGWIEKQAKISFDDAERLEAFRDSAEYRQYKDRLSRLMSYKHEAIMRATLDRIGIKKIEDLLVLTEEGRRVAGEQHDKMQSLWNRMRKLYSERSAEFQQMAKDNAVYLPLFFMMGLANGAVMAQMMIEARVDYPYWYGDLYGSGSSSTWDGSGVLDGDLDADIDFGGL